MMRLKKLLVLSVAAAAACSKSAPETQPEPQVQSVRVNNTVEAPLDCNEATRRAVANPNIDVEKVAAPLKMTPAPIDTRKMPKGVADKNGWYHVKFHVVVDAAGKPDMKTFAVDTTSHPWLATSVKSAVAQWKFSPAEVAGCKVPRNYSLGISPRGKSPAAAATKPAAKNIPKAAPAKKPPTR